MKLANYIYFGEKVEGYEIPVLNEREARAAAGILLVGGMTSFFNAYLLHDFRFTQIFVTLFMVDFFIRIFINPKYAPSLILGRVCVAHQKPEYVGAPQKRFAWSIGFILAVVMFFIIVVFEYMTPIKIAICLLCLFFLFSESAFGICVGCKIYHWVYKKSAKYCPGEVCEVHAKEPIQHVGKVQWGVLIFVLVLIVGSTYKIIETPLQSSGMKCQAGKCGGM
jgi:hypothetical protein